MPETLPTVIAGLEIALAFAGAGLLWRLVLVPAFRRERPASPLSAWEIPTVDFLLFLVVVMLGSIAAGMVANTLSRALGLVGDVVTVANGAGAQFGMLGACLAYRSRFGGASAPAPELPVAAAGPVRSGIVVFLIALPVIMITAKLWELLLLACGLPAEKQDLIGMFANAESPWLLVALIVLAVAVAPVTEELVFRAGIFRYLRTRVPRQVALWGPALFFAALHVDWASLRGLASFAPLTVLAVIFSVAYERTGRIGTPIVAHALFNLNTVVLIFGGAAV